jgi:threonine synthase
LNYLSTRGGALRVGFDQALLRGIAPDGGLYLPDAWPAIDAAAIRAIAGRPYAETAERVLAAYAGSALPAEAPKAAAQRLVDTFHHKAITPLVQLEEDLWLLELFHGPTAAFKDLAMQMMAPLTEGALSKANERLLLLTATSGDTGAAAVRAFAGSQRTALAVLHPLDRVSPVQRRQMTTVEAPNVLNLAVRGDFDDCQRLVKALLADETLREQRRLSSVNSINWGRLAGQIPYYLFAAASLGAPDRRVRFVVPTGNFGDAFAGWATKAMGLPIAGLVAAVNSNDALARAINDGVYARRAATPTASVSMDVQAPSNFERLAFEASGRDAATTRDLFEAFARDGEVSVEPGLLDALRREVTALSIDETATAAEIAHAWKAWGRIVCPHTAVGLAAARRLPKADGPTVVLSTAHPAKFPEFVSGVLGFNPPEPPSFAAFGECEERLTVIDADLAAAKAAVRSLGA